MNLGWRKCSCASRAGKRSELRSFLAQEPVLKHLSQVKLSRVHGKAALLLASLPLALFSAENPGADWPQFLGPTRNGHYAGPALTNSWPKEGPPKLWEKKVGQGFSSPVLAGGKLVLFHRVADNETVECLNPTNGQTLWKVEYPTGFRDEIRSEDDGPRSTPAIFENQVFTFGAEGMLNCLRLATGEKIWSVDTRAKFGAGTGFFGMACSPLVEGSAVLLNVGGRDQAGIVAFDRMNGKVLWKTSDDEASYSSPVAATIHGQRYAFFFTRNHLSALNPGTGKVAFDFPWSPRIHASVSAATPLILDDLIFISASYGAGAALLRFRESGPVRLWSGDDILSNHYSTSVHHDGFLYGFD